MKKARRARTFLIREWKMVLLALIVVGLFMFGGIVLWVATLDIPSIESFHTRKVPQSTKIYDKTEEVLLFDVHGEVRRTLISLDDISRNVRNATIAIEDAEFYQHKGIKPTAILRAVIENGLIFLHLSDGIPQGGSTITQQVLKNTILTNERTITRKVKEWILAIKLEREVPKDNILEIYFNETPYGGNVYGIEEASLRFFAKSASDLTLPEAAYLAALPQAPTYYSPYGSHLDALERRKNLVLAKMLENNFITREEYEDALLAQVEFQEQVDTGIKAPHFVFYIKEYLEEKYGEEMVNETGLKVITTLDYDLQKKGEEVVQNYAIENAQKFNAENAALVAIDPRNGQILTMVGSRGYFDDDIDGKFNIATAHRQPGSTFKPFVYATAFKKGFTPDTVVFDLKTQFSTSCEPTFLETSGECYSPENYDGDFKGPITFRDALAQSVNIPAIKALYLAGVPNALQTARDMGITSLNKGVNYYGLPLVLGGGEVSLLELTSAYSVFANEGVRNQPTGILRVETLDGEVLEEYEEQSAQVIDAEVTRQISSVLSDNQARTPAFGANSPLYFPGSDVAAKTGTTNDYRDVWVVGYTPTIAVGTWGGNNDNTPIDKQVAGFVLAPMWNEFMRFAIQKTPGGNFTDPQPTPVDAPPMLRGFWNTGGADSVHSILYWINKSDPRGPQPTNPQQDGQFRLWEYPVRQWVTQYDGSIPNVYIPGVSSSSTPQTSTGGSSSSQPTLFTISNPSQGAPVSANSLMTISVNITNPSGVSSVSYYLDNSFIGTSNKAPFSLSVFIADQGLHVLKAVTSGDAGQMSDEVTFKAN